MSAYLEVRNWDELFGRSQGKVVGSRLGVSYMQAQLGEVSVKVAGHEMLLKQCEMGLDAISGVVWDAGKLLVDYLAGEHPDYPLGTVLDIGCGTGICGLAAGYLSATSVTLSDVVVTDALQYNINNAVESVGKIKPSTCEDRIHFVPYNWNSPELPETLLEKFDVVLCSDVLYDAKFHRPFLECLQKLTFKV